MNAQLHYNILSRGTITPTQIIKTVAVTGTPEAITADDTIFASTVIVWGKKAARTNNSGDVYVQWTAGDGDGGYKVAAGGETWFVGRDGAKFQLSQIYVDVDTANDGVVVIYW